jgi:hypothetical protein
MTGKKIFFTNLFALLYADLTKKTGKLRHNNGSNKVILITSPLIPMLAQAPTTLSYN